MLQNCTTSSTTFRCELGASIQWQNSCPTVRLWALSLALQNRSFCLQQNNIPLLQSRSSKCSPELWSPAELTKIHSRCAGAESSQMMWVLPVSEPCTLASEGTKEAQCVSTPDSVLVSNEHGKHGAENKLFEWAPGISLWMAGH